MRNVKCENLFCFVDENCCKIIYFCANSTFEQSRGRCVGIVFQGEFQKYPNKQIFADPHIVFELLIIPPKSFFYCFGKYAKNAQRQTKNDLNKGQI